MDIIFIQCYVILTIQTEKYLEKLVERVVVNLKKNALGVWILCSKNVIDTIHITFLSLT